MTEPVDAEGVTQCDSCGIGTARPVRRMAEYTTKGGKRISFPEDVTICDNCGDAFYTREQMRNRSIAITAALEADEENPFPPDRIKRALANVRMSPAQFERAVGLGSKTVSRWERGTVPPSKAARFALWVAERFPSVLQDHAIEIGAIEARAVKPAHLTGTGQSSLTSTKPILHLDRSGKPQTLTGKAGNQSTEQDVIGREFNEA